MPYDGFIHTYPDGTSTVVHIRSGGWPLWFGKGMYATTVRKTIYIRKPYTINNISLPHELCHVDQWHKYGTIGFFFKYIWYQIRYGYNKNPFEQEARKAAGEPLR